MYLYFIVFDNVCVSILFDNTTLVSIVKIYVYTYKISIYILKVNETIFYCVKHHLKISNIIECRYI